MARLLARATSTVSRRSHTTLQTLQSQISQYSASAQEMRQQVQVLEQTCRDLRTQLAVRDVALRETRNQCNLSQADVEAMGEQLRQMREERGRVAEELRAIRRVHEELMASHLALQKGATEAQQLSEAHAEESRTLAAKYEELCAVHSSTLQSLSESTKEVSTNVAIQSALQVEQGKVSRLSEKVARTEQRLAHVVEERDALQERVKSLATQVATQRAHIGTVKQRDVREAQSASAELSKLRESVAALTLQLEAQRAQSAKGLGTAKASQPLVEAKAMQLKHRQLKEKIIEATRDAQARRCSERCTLLTILDLTAPFSSKDPQYPAAKDATPLRGGSVGDGTADWTPVQCTASENSDGSGTRYGVRLSIQHGGERPTVVEGPNTVPTETLRRRAVAAVQRVLLQLTLQPTSNGASPPPKPPPVAAHWMERAAPSPSTGEAFVPRDPLVNLLRSLQTWPATAGEVGEERAGGLASPGGEAEACGEGNKEGGATHWLRRWSPTSLNPPLLLQNTHIAAKRSIPRTSSEFAGSSSPALTASQGRGDVDGSCSPARPPVLRSF